MTFNTSLLPAPLTADSSDRESSPGLGRCLRVGLLIDDYQLPAWACKMIDNIQSSSFASIELIILNNNEPPSENNNLVQKFTRNRGRIGYLAVRKILEVIYSRIIERNTYLPDAEEIRDCTGLLKDVKTLNVTTRRKKWSDYFHETDLQAIQQLQPDILIRCGFGILRGDILKSARYGIWSFHHGDNTVNRGGPAGWWESMESWPETGSILQILSEDLDNGTLLYKSFSATDAMSVQDSKSNYYWKSLLFITRKMEELHKHGEKEFFASVEQDNLHPTIYSERLYTQPGNLELAKLTARKVTEKIIHLYQNQFKMEQWILMFHLQDQFSSSLWRYKKIVPPKDRFWADPHILKRDGKYYIFIEELIYKNSKGHISVITMDEHGNHDTPVKVLERDYHLSYPFILEHEGKTYMIPETMDNSTIELYECIDFPSKWTHKINLMEGVSAVDATLLEHDGKWWLFTSMAEQEGMSANDELFVYYADSPLSTDWTPHRLNPVVSDCKTARPAGKIYKENNRLYRPSQNCSKRYGYGFNINEIELLTETHYRESAVTKVLPNWEKKLRGTHTFNRSDRLHVIDALIERKKP